MIFNDIFEREKELHILFEKLKEVLKSELNSVNNPDGVTRLSDNIVIVKSSFLGNSWSPSYYNNKKQAELVMGYLGSCPTVKSFMEKLNELLNNKKIVYKGETIYLNKPIIEKLKEFYK